MGPFREKLPHSTWRSCSDSTSSLYVMTLPVEACLCLEDV